MRISLGRSFSLAAASACISIEAAAADRFSAFSWSHVPAPSTARVEQLLELAPWTDIPALAAALNAKPAGRRWVVIYCLTDSMADNPADRCIRRETTLVTRFVAAPPAAPSNVKPVATSTSRPMSRVAARTSDKVVAVTERVTREFRTDFRGPWMDNGVMLTKSRMRDVVSRLVAAGAKIDGFVMSNETNLSAPNIVGVPGTAEAITADPRWAKLSGQLGLPRDIRGMNWGTDLYFRWTDAMAGRFDQALNEAVFEPIRRAYPLAKVSNYNSGAIRREVAWPDINGHHDRRSTPGFGTHDTGEFYGWLAAGRIAKVKGDFDPSDAWMAFRLEVRKARGMISSSDRPRQAWIASRSWRGESWGRVPIASHPLWDELVIQLGMHGFEDFLEFSPDDPSQTASQNAVRRAEDRAHLDAVLRSLNEQGSAAFGPVITTTQPTWNDRVIATGRRTVGGTLWRFSFAEDVSHAEITCEGGLTIRVAPEPGSQGCWCFVRGDRAAKLDPTGKGPLMRVEDVGGRSSPMAAGAGM